MFFAYHRFKNGAFSWPEYLAPAVVVLAAVLGQGMPVHGQDAGISDVEVPDDWPYRVFQLPDNCRSRTNQGQLRLLAMGALRGSAGKELTKQENKRRFDLYFNGVLFRQMTHPNRLNQLANDRRILLRHVQKDAKDPLAHERLNNLLSHVMKQFARGDYHPALRYNAMLLIGQLNVREAVSTGANKAPAQPLSTMIPVLLEDLTDPKQIDAVRVAALTGIQRHAEAGLPAVSRNMIVQEMLSILTSKDPPKGRSADGHAWMQRQAMGILGTIGSLGSNDQVASALNDVIIDAQQPFSLRCAAAVAQGKLRFPADTKIDLRQLAAQVGAVGVEACRTELLWLKERVEKRLEEQPGLVDGDRLAAELIDASAEEDEEEREVDPVMARLEETSRRRLKHRLDCVRQGLGGRRGEAGGIFALAEGTPHQKYVSDVIESVEKLLGVLENIELSAQDLIVEIGNAGAVLESLVQEVIVPKETPPKTTGPDQPGGSGPDEPGGSGPDEPGGASPDEPGGSSPDEPGGASPDEPGGSSPDEPGGASPDERS